MRLNLRIPVTLMLATLANLSLAPFRQAQSEPPVPAVGPRYSSPSYSMPSYITQSTSNFEPTQLEVEPPQSEMQPGKVQPAFVPYELKDPTAGGQNSATPPFVWQPPAVEGQTLGQQPFVGPFAQPASQLEPAPPAPPSEESTPPGAETTSEKLPAPERHGPITALGEPLPAATAERLPPPNMTTPQPAPPFPAPRAEDLLVPTGETPLPTTSSNSTSSNSTLRTASTERRSLVDFRQIRNQLSNRQPLASVPGMFGDFLEPAIQLSGTNGAQRMAADVPLGGGGRRLKIAENNSALPTDRVILGYNRFGDALNFDSDTATAGGLKTSDVNRFSFGFEMADRTESWSLETRFTFAEHYAGAGDDFSLQGSGLGNAMLGVKRILFTHDHFALTGGLGFDFPTGGDAILDIGAHRLQVKNDAVHAMPYLASVFEAGPFFFQGFSQADLALSGNGVEAYDDCLCTTGNIGQYTEQNYWHNDIAVGVWLLSENTDLRWIKGLAVLAEYHHTVTLNDSDSISHTFSLGESITLSNPANRVDPANITFGIHTLLHSNTEVRLGVAIPVSDGDDRWFDSEWMLQINQRL